MHPSYSMLYAFRLSFTQVGNPALYRTRHFDRRAATSAALLATLGLSMSMFSLKQLRSTHQRRSRILN